MNYIWLHGAVLRHRLGRQPPAPPHHRGDFFAATYSPGSVYCDSWRYDLNENKVFPNLLCVRVIRPQTSTPCFDHCDPVWLLLLCRFLRIGRIRMTLTTVTWESICNTKYQWYRLTCEGKATKFKHTQTNCSTVILLAALITRLPILIQLVLPVR
jgi:hypothetical protein